MEALTKALAETKDKLLHSYAERENIRRIAAKDVENAKEFGIKGFANKMFDVIDTVELCLQSSASLPKDNPDVQSVISAMDAVRKQFIKVMGEYDVVPLVTNVGDKFDANLHNAMFPMAASAPEHLPNTIAVIVKHGWLRKGALLRPTSVGVYSNV